MFKEKSGNSRRKDESQGKVKEFRQVDELLKFNLIAVSAKMLYQKVVENALRSGRSQGK